MKYQIDSEALQIASQRIGAIYFDGISETTLSRWCRIVSQHTHMDWVVDYERTHLLNMALEHFQELILTKIGYGELYDAVRDALDALRPSQCSNMDCKYPGRHQVHPAITELEPINVSGDGPEWEQHLFRAGHYTSGGSKIVNVTMNPRSPYFSQGLRGRL